MGMKLSNFNFDLPQELLAEYPAANRDDARLMVLNRKEKTIEHKMFKDLIDYFKEDDVLVLNNTKVFRTDFLEIRKRLAQESRCSCYGN